MSTQTDEADLYQFLRTHTGFDFLFRIQTDPGFTPPPRVLAITDHVRINLSLGIHYFYTAVEHKRPSFSALIDFINLTQPGQFPHRFQCDSLSIDTEESIGLSNRFGRFLGLGFMSEFADSTWFMPLPRIGSVELTSPKGRFVFSRADIKESWPDYLSAPFNPRLTDSNSLGAIYPLEFKGIASYMTFDSAKFQDWLHQSCNITIEAPRHSEFAMKSWVLVFNYRCQEMNERHHGSTFLVRDPRIGPEQAPLPPPEMASSIIRAHLARQCRKLGFPLLGAYVLASVYPEMREVQPPVYRIRHPKFEGRRYIGRFVYWGLDGEPIAISTNPLLGSDITRAHIHVGMTDSGSFSAHGYARSSEGDCEIHIHYYGGSRRNEEAMRSQLRRLLTGHPTNVVFLGQDAKMLKQVLRLRPDEEIADGEFNIPFEISIPGYGGLVPETQEVSSGAVQLLRNGSIIANSRLVESVDEDFWT